MDITRRQVLAALAYAGVSPQALAQLKITPGNLGSLLAPVAKLNDKFGRFSKGFVHNEDGLMHDRDDLAWRDAVSTGSASAWDALRVPNDMRLVNPLAAYVWQDLPMAKEVALPPAPPSLDSETLAREALELYWMALLRDENLGYAKGSRAWAQTQKDLGKTPFSLGLFGEDKGHPLSQFLFLPVPYGSQLTFQKYKTPAKAQAFMVAPKEWQRIQDGHWPSLPEGVTNWDSEPHYLRTGRDLAEYVRSDFSYQPFITAAAILNHEAHRPREGLAKGHPYKTNPSQNGFVSFGSADVFALLGRATDLALKAAWACKWLHHPLLRPEEYGGHVAANRYVPKWLRESEPVKRVLAEHGSALLPQAYPEGSPLHPSYVSGHATIAGACVTVLKAFYDGNRVFRFPQVPSRDGRDTEASPVADLTYAGELNKLAANMAVGRMWAGIHWRSDSLEGLKLGERIGHALLKEHLANTPEVKRGQAISLTYLDLFGNPITL